jgi:hypothetical protein
MNGFPSDSPVQSVRSWEFRVEEAGLPFFSLQFRSSHGKKRFFKKQVLKFGNNRNLFSSLQSQKTKKQKC